jgi:hypothetical protein
LEGVFSREYSEIIFTIPSPTFVPSYLSVRNILPFSKTKQFSFRKAPEAPLPDHWDMNTTEEGVRYFIDHKNKITTFQDPRNPTANSIPANGVKSFRWKYGQFRYLCQSNAMNQVRHFLSDKILWCASRMTPSIKTLYRLRSPGVQNDSFFSDNIISFSGNNYVSVSFREIED